MRPLNGEGNHNTERFAEAVSVVLAELEKPDISVGERGLQETRSRHDVTEREAYSLSGLSKLDPPPKMTDYIFNSAKRCLIVNGIPRDEADTVLQALCYIIVGEETEHLMFDAEAEVTHLKCAGITLTQISEELSYRDVARIEGPEPGCSLCGLDVDLCEYNTDELSDIETAWSGSIQ